jgi:hypothetical protein
VQAVQPTVDAVHRSPRIQQGEVGVGADPNAPVRRKANHIEKPRVHHRFPEPLQMKLLQSAPLLDQACELVERHERKRTIRRTILPELDSAHLAAEVALTNWLDLEVGWEIHSIPRMGVADREARSFTTRGRKNGACLAANKGGR